MLEFWLRGIWKDQDGWEFTVKFNVFAASRESTKESIDKNLRWCSNHLPGKLEFQGVELVKVEEV